MKLTEFNGKQMKEREGSDEETGHPTIAQSHWVIPQNSESK